MHSAQTTAGDDISPENKSTTLFKLWIKATALSLGIVLVLLILTGFAAGIFIFSKLQSFTTFAGVSISELQEVVSSGLKQSPIQTNDKKNILLLGTDSVLNRGEAPPLTDTMVIVSADLKTGTITTLPLPRDIWNNEYQTKINALYYYGQERSPERPETFVEDTVEEMFGLPIHHTVILSMESVAAVVDLIDGVEISIPQSFTDDTFPRSDVSLSETSQDELFTTVTFQQGTELMSGKRALTYMRSRKSSTPDEATDIARSRRQQQVINAIVKKVTSSEVLLDPALLGRLYKLYREQFSSHLSETELIATLKVLYPVRANLQLLSQHLSLYPEADEGVLYHPPNSELTNTYQRQWVFVVRDPEQLRLEVKRLLNLKTVVE